MIAGAWRQVDAVRISDELRRRFPCVRMAWFGLYTGRWWALVLDAAGHHRLVEAGDPAELSRRVAAVDGATRGDVLVVRRRSDVSGRVGRGGGVPGRRG
ncbi:hypothetical protein [Actinomadura fibrosa]|uniref:Uncharacterized protein n=1 Tax=Actinomadura fibrosa TaxID=111802 RepID=A0ABW2XIQ8_9ACTN|nr:hypothetical protein [Actinomadura fibrosa]